jgi:hypothetical protein
MQPANLIFGPQVPRGFGVKLQGPEGGGRGEWDGADDGWRALPVVRVPSIGLVGEGLIAAFNPRRR